MTYAEGSGRRASRFVTIVRITLPSASRSIATGIVLSIARAAGETAPLIFTALYSPWWADGIFNPIGTLSVLIYKFATMPYDVQTNWHGPLPLCLWCSSSFSTSWHGGSTN